MLIVCNDIEGMSVIDRPPGMPEGSKLLAVALTSGNEVQIPLSAEHASKLARLLEGRGILAAPASAMPQGAPRH